MNLIEYRDQNTLPEQVSVNKENIERLSDAIDKLGYAPRGEYDATVEYGYNDVVFYNSRLYAMIKENGAIVGVLPTNTEYWQVITGDIRGQQGAQGERGQQGEQGEQGEPGETPIFYRTVDADATDVIDGYYHTLSALNFLKRPTSEDVGKRVVYYHLNTSTNKVYLVEANITSASIESTAVNTITLRVVQITGEKGDNGADGLPALVYDGTIPFVRNDEETQLVMTPTISSIGSFNHIPALNEDFVALLKDTNTNIVYIANCEVQTKVGNNPTSIVISNIARLTGADGQNGTNGTDGTNGKDALVCKTPKSTIQAVGATQNFAYDNFNRTPELNDVFNVVIELINGKSYISGYQITGIYESYVQGTCLYNVETTGAGTTLNKYTFLTSSTPTLAQRKRLVNIILNAKGKVIVSSPAWGNNACALGNNPNATNGQVSLTLNFNQVGGSAYMIIMIIDADGLYNTEITTEFKADGTIVTTQGTTHQLYVEYYNDIEITA